MFNQYLTWSQTEASLLEVAFPVIDTTGGLGLLRGKPGQRLHEIRKILMITFGTKAYKRSQRHQLSRLDEK